MWDLGKKCETTILFSKVTDFPIIDITSTLFSSNRTSKKDKRIQTIIPYFVSDTHTHTQNNNNKWNIIQTTLNIIPYNQKLYKFLRVVLEQNVIASTVCRLNLYKYLGFVQIQILLGLCFFHSTRSVAHTFVSSVDQSELMKSFQFFSIFVENKPN